ncbi:MAG: alpha/beta hydrolase [Acidobacteria bacterium]|nr:alpha/beta hydrolase [Acidobacteriota bacterium]
MKLFSETHGDGTPIVLIPGFASGAWIWFRQIAGLAGDFRVVTFDPRGIGRSRVARLEDLADLTMASFVDDVKQILDEHGIEKAVVAGASFGGFVAQEFALKYRERVEKLVLCCTSAGGPGHVKPAPEILQAFVPDPSLTVGERIRKHIGPAFTDRFNAEHPDEVERVCRLREENEVHDAVYLAQIQAAFLFDTNARLENIDTATLVVTGRDDRVVPIENSLNLAAKLPRARLEIIDHGSHLFFVEQAEQFNEIISRFVRGA